MHILGVNAYHPDSSACIIRDGCLVAAAEEERFKRIKHWAGLPLESMRFCLNQAGVAYNDLDFIALNRNPQANLHKKLLFILTHYPSSEMLKNRFSNVLKIKDIESDFSREFTDNGAKKKPRAYYIEHHRAHLASAFFVSGFREALVFSLDGFGDFSSCMAAAGKENKLQYLFEINYPHSLGIFYSAFTQYLGFNKFGDEYKVMGLAAYGKPRYAQQMKNVLMSDNDGRYRLNHNYFNLLKDTAQMSWHNTEPALGALFSDSMVKEFGRARPAHEKLGEFHCDIAASVQYVYEEAFFKLLNYLYRLKRLDTLCLAGGCALNSLANGKIFDRTPFREVFIQPASSDAGGSLGAAYYLYNQILGKERGFVMTHAYWGPSFDKAAIREAIDSTAELKNQPYAIEEFADYNDLCRVTAQYIAEGKIIGWFQGRMEWGPRALGNRSILVDPRRKEMQDILNERIKRREWFRPFAPAILLEKVGEYFECSYPDPFMLKVYPIRKEKRESIPAVTHNDGTGRLQTVTREENYLYWRLIREFEKITGIPVLLNTSFNENEPIVCNPQQAIDCFLRTKMDVLVLGDYLIRR